MLARLWQVRFLNIQLVPEDSEVSTDQFNIALHIQHQVLRLQVSVHDVFLVEVGVGLHHAGSAEHSDGLVKTPSEEAQKDWSVLQPLTALLTFKSIFYLLSLSVNDISFVFVLTAFKSWNFLYCTHYRLLSLFLLAAALSAASKYLKWLHIICKNCCKVPNHGRVCRNQTKCSAIHKIPLRNNPILYNPISLTRHKRKKGHFCCLCFLTLLWVWSRSLLRHRTPWSCRCIVCLWKQREACGEENKMAGLHTSYVVCCGALCMSVMSAIPDDEVALDGLKDLLLKQHVLFLPLGNDMLLADPLHGVIRPMIHCGHLRMTKKKWASLNCKYKWHWLFSEYRIKSFIKDCVKIIMG